MPLIMPITDLRKTNEISDICHKTHERTSVLSLIRNYVI